MSGRGKRVRSAAKAIIFNMYKYFERQASSEERCEGHYFQRVQIF